MLSGVEVGTGTGTASETLCIGGVLGVGCPNTQKLSATRTTNPTSGTAVINFAGVNEVDYSKDISVAGGGGPNVGELSIVENSLSETVPEPASLAILAVSLLGMSAGAAFRRHRK